MAVRDLPAATASPADETPAQIAQRYGLSEVGGIPPLPRYLREVWDRRHFAWTMARAKVRSRNSRDVLGPLWTFLQPLFLAGIYLAIFGGLVGAGRDIPNYPAYLTIGIFTFHYLQTSVRQSANALSGNANLVRSLQFPRAILPIMVVLQQLILLLPTTIVMIIVVLVTGARPSPTWLLVPVVFAMLTVFTIGLSLVVARVASHSHDFVQVLPFIMRLWFYLSGVFWSVDRVDKFPVLRFLFEVNPGFVFLHLNREALLPTVTASDYATWPLAVFWTVLSIVVGVLFFWRGEDRYGRH